MSFFLKCLMYTPCIPRVIRSVVLTRNIHRNAYLLLINILNYVCQSQTKTTIVHYLCKSIAHHGHTVTWSWMSRPLHLLLLADVGLSDWVCVQCIRKLTSQMCASIMQLVLSVQRLTAARLGRQTPHQRIIGLQIVVCFLSKSSELE